MAEHGGEGGALRELLAVFGFGVDTKELKEGESKLGEFLDKVKEIGEGIAAAFAVEKLFEFAEGQVHAMTAVEHLAAQIGISTDEVQAWQFAAESAGFEADRFLQAMSRLQLAAGNTGGGKAFSELGINIKDAAGKSKDASALFADVAEAVRKTEDPNRRAAIATKLFGRSGRELLPFLAEGRDGVDDLMKAYKQLGGAFGEKQIAQGKEFEKGQAKLNLTWKGLKATVADTLIPIFTKLMKVVTPILASFKDLVAHSSIVKTTLMVLGAAAAAFAAQMVIAAWPVIAIAAAVAALILVVDDLIGLFTGKDSEIGHVIDQIFGKGASAEAVSEIKGAWQGVKDVFSAFGEILRPVWDFFKFIYQFGEEIASKIKKIAEPLGAAASAAGGFIKRHIGENATNNDTANEAWKTISSRIGVSGAAMSSMGAPSMSVQPNMSMAPPVVVHQTINPSPGMDEKKLGQHAAEHVEKIIRQRNRATAATLERAPSGT